MRFARWIASALLVFCFAVPALAADDEKKDDEKKDDEKKDDEKKDSDEFSTSWVGVRAEMWYQPALSLDCQVGGFSPLLAQIVQNTHLNVHDDLGVQTNTPKPTYLDFGGGPLALDVFVDTRWVSLDVWAVTPFEYKGSTVLTRTIDYGGFRFQVSRPVETSLEQAIAGFDIKVNLLNNRFVRVSPIVALRALAIDWSVRDADTNGTVFRASTEDIDFPLTVGQYKVLPYPEVGAEVRAGYRDFIEVDLKLTGCYVNYAGVVAKTAIFEAGITGYAPFLPNVGVRLGYRYYYFNARTEDQSPDQQFNADMRISGATFSLIVRF